MHPISTFLPAAPPYQAVFSSCGCYRYDWHYRWGAGKCVMFIGLNPSVANIQRTDATVRRCIAFAKSWGYGAVRLVNLFSWVDPYPVGMLSASHPVGADNERYIISGAKESDLIVAVWGNDGSYQGRDLAVKQMLKGRLNALQLNKNGSPSHPLFLRKDLQPFPWA